ncbi:3-oxo-5-alpha-steroid 4-dehydrogenase [Obelidium mucronatum]|nr:3-oxo-5-alpha-steroid 4-dehydrogenase [Obelidium mucronatum]
MIHYLHRSLVYTYFAPSMSSTNIVIIVMATAFNIPNGYVNGFAASVTPSDRIYDWKFWAGIAVFAIGMAINISADYTLFALRRKKVNEKGHQKYFIPYGFMFEYVSSANYLGEIIEWIGWAIACGNPAAYSFMFFTMANLVPRALSTHKFYKDTFKTAYPTSRKAIIPFLL